MKLNFLRLSYLVTSAIAFGSLYGLDSSDILLHVAKKSLSTENERMLGLQVIKQDHVLKLDFLQKMRELFKLELFIETGTYYGETSLQASKVFDQVYTVELSDYIFEKNRSKFNNYPNIHAFRGRSEKFLENILPSLKDKKIVFWLDAHYSGGETSFADKFTPIIEEIAAIEKSGIKNSIILIDDIRHFYQENAPYPSLANTMGLILRINTGYRFAIIGDTLIAYPQDEDITVSSVVHACTISRLYNEDAHLIASGTVDIVEVEKNIAEASGLELQEIERLQRELSWEEATGLNRGLYNWWYGLTRLSLAAYDEAIRAFTVSYKSITAHEELHEKLKAYISKILS